MCIIWNPALMTNNSRGGWPNNLHPFSHFAKMHTACLAQKSKGKRLQPTKIFLSLQANLCFSGWRILIDMCFLNFPLVCQPAPKYVRTKENISHYLIKIQIKVYGSKWYKELRRKLPSLTSYSPILYQPGKLVTPCKIMSPFCTKLHIFD